MIPELRQHFNERWTEDAYRELLRGLEAELGEQPQFRIAETPLFLPEELLHRMLSVSSELVGSLLTNADFLRESEMAIPEAFHFREPEGVRPPNFMTVDFGFIQQPDGTLDVCLVELQAFPSVLGFRTCSPPLRLASSPSIRTCAGFSAASPGTLIGPSLPMSCSAATLPRRSCCWR